LGKETMGDIFCAEIAKILPKNKRISTLVFIRLSFKIQHVTFKNSKNKPSENNRMIKL
jgi:hypothetical protein